MIAIYECKHLHQCECKGEKQCTHTFMQVICVNNSCWCESGLTINNRLHIQLIEKTVATTVPLHKRIRYYIKIIMWCTAHTQQ